MITPNFDVLIREILSALHRRIGFDLWMVTRIRAEDWVILKVEDQGYGVAEGGVFPWADSLCYQMALGNGPSIAPAVDQVAAYREAPIRKKLRIGAYAGIPIVSEDGDLFGTLCAVHPSPMAESIQGELPLLRSIGELLGIVIAAQRECSSLSRQAEKAEAELLRDPLTGLFNRPAWDKFIDSEEERCLRSGHTACVVLISLSRLDQGDDISGYLVDSHSLRLAAEAIQATLVSRPKDFAARTAGNEFSVLCVDCGIDEGIGIADRFERQLNYPNLRTTVRVALRKPLLGLSSAWKEANHILQVEAVECR